MAKIVPEPIELCNQAETMFIGGIASTATLYREIDAGRHPRSIRVSANRVMWVKSELLARLRAMVDGPRERIPPRRPFDQRRPRTKKK